MNFFFRTTLILFSLVSTGTFAQIGMSNNKPSSSAVLDLTNLSGAPFKGLLLPNISLAATNLSSPLSLHTAGMHVYNTANSGTGANRVYPGEYYNDGMKWIRLEVWSLLGNANTDPKVNFLGTIDDTPFIFKIGGRNAGIISKTNTGFGSDLFKDLAEIAKYNTVFGYGNLNGLSNSGSYNIGVGTIVLSGDNLSGKNNIGFGSGGVFGALSTGNSNISFGANGNALSTGSDNIAVGQSIGISNTGDSNIAFGYDSFAYNQSGAYNISISKSVLQTLTTGSYNIGIGWGYGNVGNGDTGINNIAMGSGQYSPGFSTASSANEMNIANTLYGTGLNGTIGGGKIGINTKAPSATLSVRGTANNTSGTWTVFSDSRVKTVEGFFNDGINIISKIKPVKFHYNSSAPIMSNEEQIGVVAQELEKAAPYMVNKIKYEGELGKPVIEDLREVDNQAYVFLLINTLKEQHKQVEELRNELNKLQSKN